MIDSLFFFLAVDTAVSIILVELSLIVPDEKYFSIFLVDSGAELVSANHYQSPTIV